MARTELLGRTGGDSWEEPTAGGARRPGPLCVPWLDPIPGPPALSCLSSSRGLGLPLHRLLRQDQQPRFLLATGQGTNRNSAAAGPTSPSVSVSSAPGLAGAGSSMGPGGGGGLRAGAPHRVTGWARHTVDPWEDCGPHLTLTTPAGTCQGTEPDCCPAPPGPDPGNSSRNTRCAQAAGLTGRPGRLSGSLCSSHTEEGPGN